MAHEFQNSPFVTSASGIKPFDTLTNDSGGEPALDYLGESSLGDLYWNSTLPSVGLVCGAAASENSIIIRRLLSSHLNHQTSEVLIIHTDHFSLRSTKCSLLPPEWQQVRILVSPDADEDLTSIYNAGDGVASPITFKDNFITLRHVLALFTPPPAMQGSSAILGTVQLIVSQLRPPFDLQRFIELVDQEKWSEEGANFMALRQTLLTKLLSPSGDDENEETPRRIRLVDLTDPVLQSTGLDNAIMVVAMHDFMRGAVGRKLIVLNNCQEYLFHPSSLNKTLESLAAQGSDRPTSILLSTTDPTTIPYSVLHSLDYIIFGSSRSLHWNEFLHKNFTKHVIPKTQSRIGRAMIWSPGSSIYALDTSKKDSKTRKSWDDLLSFIDIEQFERSMPSTPVPNAPSEVTLVNNGNAEGTMTEPNEPEDRSTTQETAPTHVNEEDDSEDEEGIISLDKLGILEPPTTTHAAPPSTFGSSSSANEEVKASPMEPPNRPTEPNKSTPAKVYPLSKFYPLTAAISQLCDGEVGILVGFEAVRKQLGTREDVKKLGWTTFTQFVKAACDSRAVELIEADPGSKFLALLPTSPRSTGSGAIAQTLPKDASNIHRDKPEFWASDPALPTANDGNNLPVRESNASPIAWSRPDLAPSTLKSYPDQYVTLLSAIIRLSGSSTGVKIPLVAVRDEIGESTIVKELITYGWTTFGQWIRCACLEKYVEQGGTGNGAWVTLLEVDHVATQTGTTSAESIRSSKTLMGEEKPPGEHNGDASKHQSEPLPEGTYQTPTGAISNPQEPLASGASKTLAFAMNEETSVRGGATQPVGPSNGSSPQASGHVGEPLGPMHKPHSGSPSNDSSQPALMRDGPPEERNEQPNPLQQPTFTAAKASDYPSKHLPVVSAMLKLTGGILGAEVRMKGLIALLQVEYPRAREDFLVSLVATAEEDNILLRKLDDSGNVWASLQSLAPHPNPPAPLKQENPTQPLSSEPALGSPHVSPSRGSAQVPQRTLAAGDFPLKHRAVVSIMIKLTNGIPGTKVRTADLTDSLRNEYRGAREEFLLSLIVKTAEDHILELEVDRAGVEWVLLRDPASTEDSIRLSQKYPAPHNAVASVIQSLVVGDAGKEVPLSLVHRELCYKGHAASMQRAVDMTTAATAAHVMRIQRDDDGERYALLEDPDLSRGLLIPEPTPKSHPLPPEIKEPSPGHAGASNASPTNSPRSNLPANSLNTYPKQYATLISAIMQLSGGSNGVKVPLSNVRKEIGDKLLAQEMLAYGWSTLEQWVQGACLERYMEKGGTGKGVWVMLNMVKHVGLQSSTRSTESTPPDAMQAVEQSLPLEKSISASKNKPNQMPDETHQAKSQAAGYAPENHPNGTLAETSKPSTFCTVNASEYPFKHRPVVSTILKLTGGVLGAKVRMIDFTASLRLDYPRAQEDFLCSLIYSAETDGVLRREKDLVNILWVTLQTPASLRGSPTPSTPAPKPLPASHPQIPPQPPSPTLRSTHSAPPGSPMQLESLNPVDFPLKHRAVVSTIIKLTNGVRAKKVRMADLTGALRSEYRSAKGDFLFSLIVKAEDDHVLERETDRAGLVWVSLRALSAGVSDLTSQDYPIPHRAVVSVIHSLVGGDVGREVPIDLVHGELRRKGYARTTQGAVDMTTDAAVARVMRVQRDEAGERYAILEDPKLSKSFSDSKSISEQRARHSEDKQPSFGHELEGYQLVHRPLISTIFTLTNGQCHVRVKMESIIRALMKDPSAKYRDAEVVASLIFAAADAEVVQCGKDDRGTWWTSAKEPVRQAPQTPKAVTQGSVGHKPQIPSSPLAARKPLGSEVLRTSAFSPLIDALKLLKGDTFAEIPYATTVASRVLALMPNVLQQAGCSSMSEYFDLADARGVIWSVGNGDKRMVRLRHD